MSRIRLQPRLERNYSTQGLDFVPLVCVFARASVWRGGAQSAAVLVHLMAGPEDSRQGSSPSGIGAGSGEGQGGSPALLRPDHCALQVKRIIISSV